MNKLTIDFIREKCREKGVELLSQTYTKAKDKMRFRCSCGNEFKCSWDKFNNRGKTQCNDCGAKLRSKERSLNIDIIKEKCKNIGIEVLSEQYEKAHKKLIFKCECGEIFKRTWANVSKGQTKCLTCSNIKRWDIDKIKVECKNLGIEILSDKYLNNQESMLFKCSCGEVFKRNWSQIINLNQITCNTCSRKASSERQRRTVEYLENKCKDFEIELLSKEYLNNAQKLSFKCKCGNIFVTSWAGVLSGKTCCNTCSKIESKAVSIIKEYLDKNNYTYIREYRFSDCRDIIPLPFDFAVIDGAGKVNLLIEYDGEQHYKPINFGGISKEEACLNLEKQRYHDELKNKYCKDNNIHLLRIPYWEKNNIKKILEKILN